jgi:hypothetical protein
LVDGTIVSLVICARNGLCPWQTAQVPDPSGAAPSLLWPAGLIRPEQRTVYLDLNHWVGLSQAATGHREGHQFLGVLEACRSAAAGGVLFPISSVTYIEVSKIKDPRQRADLAAVIQELSGFHSLISHALLVTLELDAAVSAALSVPSAMGQDLAYVGRGVGYAFGQVLTPTFAGDGLDGQVQALIEAHGQGVLDGLITGFELYALQGPDDEEAAELRQTGWDPEAAWKIAVERAGEERAQAGRFEAVRTGVALNDEEQLSVDTTDRKDWRRGRLRDAIAVRELTKCIWDLFGQVLSWYGQPGVDELLGNDRDQSRTFVRQMPSTEVAVELKTIMHRDAARAARWLPNDVLDIDQLAMAVPYCDVIVTEKAARDALVKARLDERCETVLLRRLQDLPAHL